MGEVGGGIFVSSFCALTLWEVDEGILILFVCVRVSVSFEKSKRDEEEEEWGKREVE